MFWRKNMTGKALTLDMNNTLQKKKKKKKIKLN